MTENLRAAIWRANDNPRAVLVYFQARELEELVAFRLATSAPILSSFWEMPSLQGGHWLKRSESRATHHYAIALADHKFLNQPFMVGLELDTDGDPRDHVTAAETWDRTDAESQIIYMEFPNVA